MFCLISTCIFICICISIVLTESEHKLSTLTSESQELVACIERTTSELNKLQLTETELVDDHKQISLNRQNEVSEYHACFI